MPNETARTKARRLRREMSLPEVLLWQLLKNKGADVRFRRQHPIGSYVLDFYCAELKMAVEVDGMAHDTGDRPERDEIRDAWLSAQGIEVVRLPAADVLRDPAAAAEALRRLCLDR